jgi:thiosulfate/3-mercaptopyruvate sulfurtransferase
MKKALVTVCLAAFLLLLPVALLAGEVSPIVSTEWLEKNLNDPKLKIVDIRKVEDFKEGHIPGALNVYFGAIAIKKNELRNELPDDEDLVDILNSSGIAGDSLIVIVGKTDTFPETVSPARVALTFEYAGLKNLAVLDGGYKKWVAEKKQVTQEAVKPKPSDYKPKWNKKIFVGKEYVLKAMKKAVLLDARAPELFFGVSKMDFVAKPGHIRGAVSLPSAWLFTKEAVFRSKDDVATMAANVIGKDKVKEVIGYCDTGLMASMSAFYLREVLGYKNVRLYDGSMEEWAKDPKAPVVKYTWR